MNTINETKLRTVPCFADPNYTIYEDGRIYSEYRNKFINPTISNKNQVLFNKHGSVARTVWQSFHGALDRRTVVSFKDGDSTNVALSNLYIRTYSEMNASSHANKTTVYPSLLLDDAKITLLLENLRNNVNLNQIAEDLGCSSAHLRAILQGRSVKWFFDKYGPFDYYKGIRKEYELSGKYVGRLKRKSECYIQYNHKHGSRKPSVIKELCTALSSKVCNINNIADIKHKFDISTYQAVKLKQSIKGVEA